MTVYVIERLHATQPPEHLETTVRDERAARLAAENAGISEGAAFAAIRDLSPMYAPSVSFLAGAGYDTVRVTAESA